MKKTSTHSQHFRCRIIFFLFLFSSFVASSQPVCDAHFQHYAATNPDSLHFYPATAGTTGHHYLWNFGDSGTSAAIAPWHYYPHGGTFVVCLTVWDSTFLGTCTATWCDTVFTPIVDPLLCDAHFQFTFTADSDSIQFHPVTINSAGLAYSWNFGDGTTSSLRDPWHLFNGGGNHVVCLTVSRTQGTPCTATWCDTIHTSTSPPVCNAHFQHYSAANPDSIHFYPGNTNTSGYHYFWTFGDGSSSTLPFPWHYYPNGGSFLVCLTVTDSTPAGTCTDTWCDSIHIPVAQPPVCNAHFQHYSAANPDSINFYPVNTNTAGYHYLWTFGDGSTSNHTDPWHYYPNGGNFLVCLTVTDSTPGGTCTATWCDSIHIPVAQPPVCNAHFQHYSAANPDSVHFYPGNTNTSGYHYLWTFGDGSSSTLPFPWHYYPNGGSFLVCLTVNDSTPAGTCTDTWCDSIHLPVAQPPVCNAHFQHYSAANPDSINFYPVNTNSAGYHYLWTFGDGSSSNHTDPWHYYPNGGNFLVCLTVTDSTPGGTCTATWCDSIHIPVAQPPVCNAHFQHYSAANPDSLHFYPGNANTSGYHYLWTFGDGSSSTLPFPWHYYPNGGNFLVCLTVTDSTLSGTCTATWCDSIHIPVAQPPVCNAHFQHYSGGNPDSVHFYSGNSGITGYHYLWTFGDGSSSTLPYPWHYYPNGGSFYVCLTVTDSTPSGTCTATWCDSIHVPVPQPPVCNAHFLHYFSANPDSVHFYPAPSNAAGYHYQWTFGDGSSSNHMDPWHYYPNGGSFLVCLTVTYSTPGGTCSSTWCDSIHIPAPQPPVCNAHFQHYSAANPDSVHFYPGNTHTSGYHYLWTFGDGSASTLPFPWHYYPNGGNFLVCLTVTDSTPAGTCTATWCDSIHIPVPQPPVCNAHFQHYSAANPDSIHFYPGNTNTSGYHFLWTFGDGSSSTLPFPWHYYPNGGSFLVCLTVTDSTPAGTCTATWCDSIHIPVPQPPVCNAHFQHYAAANPDSVHFYPVTAGNAGYHYQWTFGDGSSSNHTDPWHYYPNGGSYLVCLTVTDSTSAGTCVATWCDSIHIAPMPPTTCIAQFQHYSTANPDSIHFYPLNGNATGYSYHWSFGDSTYSTAHDPWHVFTTSGTHVVCLTITSTVAGVSCTATWCENVSTPRHFSMQINPNPLQATSTVTITGLDAPASFLLYDQNGRLLFRLEQVTNGSFTLDRENLRAGIYYYQLLGSDDVLSKGRLVVQ